jgi:hypothetical protein
MALLYRITLNRPLTNNELDGNFNEGSITSAHQHYFSNYIFKIKQIANKFGSSK